MMHKHREHPFDRYAPFVDVNHLKLISGRPLRKSFRVNTLKCSVERFLQWASACGWRIEPIDWCKEGFYIDRDDRAQALGKDLLHRIGATYIQESASMLPVALLDPQPGESVLDLCAAPGSKSTQMAAMMGNTGVIVCSDPQEHRLWTLKSSLHRCGVANALVLKKVGQWYSKHMTERFDRVLCDAPCSAQGTARKDSDALQYCGPENIAKMARLQETLLEAAIHSAKVGGRIVYSTCTLTPEENEGVVLQMLKKFGDQLSMVDPLTLPGASMLHQGDADARQVFATLCDAQSMQMQGRLHAVRLWPQTYDTEGFFCAVFQKTAQTREIEPIRWVHFQEEPLLKHRKRTVAEALLAEFGSTFLRDDEELLSNSEQIYLLKNSAYTFGLPVADYSLGLPFAKELKDGRIRISHELSTLRGAEAIRGTLEIDDDALDLLLHAKDAVCSPSRAGDLLLLRDSFCIGRGLAKNGLLKNNLPREMVR